MNKPFNRNFNFRGKRDLHKINSFISSEEVRVILDDGEQLGVMKKFIAIGWIIYPIGFLLALSSNESFREIAYNIADVINKVGFGVACVIAAQMLTKFEAEGSIPTAE